MIGQLHCRSANRRGLTITELLVVLGIVALLLAMLMPAVNAAREAARRTQCSNNLRQLGLALIGHDAAQRNLPYGGWGGRWGPVPGRGSEERQPGGWLWAILPFIEEPAIQSMIDRVPPPADAPIAMSALEGDRPNAQRFPWISAPLEIATCPTRRAATLYPVTSVSRMQLLPYTSTLQGQRVARTDYAMNSGADNMNYLGGPTKLDDGEATKAWRYNRELTGLIHYQRGTSLMKVERNDGLSNTYMLGEKYIYYEHYDTGESEGDSGTMFNGHSRDNSRFVQTYLLPLSDSIPYGHMTAVSQFGSAHSAGTFFVFCDGNVHLVPFDIDPIVHCRNGSRLDHRNGSICK
jgi:type II secretory pathway pseudopilin PulG